MHPLEKGMATTPVLLSGESHEQRSLAGCSPRDHQQSGVTERLSMHASMNPCELCLPEI